MASLFKKKVQLSKEHRFFFIQSPQTSILQSFLPLTLAPVNQALKAYYDSSWMMKETWVQGTRGGVWGPVSRNSFMIRLPDQPFLSQNRMHTFIVFYQVCRL